MAPKPTHPTRTLHPILTQRLRVWGDICLDAVACEGSRLIDRLGCCAWKEFTRYICTVTSITSLRKLVYLVYTKEYYVCQMDIVLTAVWK